MPRQRLGEIEVHYELAGSGAPVLYISGTGGDLRVRPNVFDAPLTAQARVLAYDQRGLGQTTIPQRQPSMADYADDAAGLLTALAFEPVAVVGVSFGGMVAQELALRYPQHVPRLVLCCTSSGGAGGSSYPLHDLADLTPEARVRRQLEILDVRMDEAWQQANPDHVAAARRRMSAARAVGEGESGRARGAAMQLAARRQHDTADRLHRLAMPVLVTGGRHDGIAPPANQHALAERVPGAELRLYDGGHLFLVQDQNAWAEITRWALDVGATP